MIEKFTIKEIELIQLAMEYLDSELPEYESAHLKLEAMRKAQTTVDNSEVLLQTQFIRSDGVKCWLSNHLPCDEWSESCMWRCTICGGVGTVGRCCGKETREPCEVGND